MAARAKTLRRTSQFKRDAKRSKRRGKDVAKLRAVIEKLARGEALEERLRDHALAGEYQGTRECHVEPDWLLIYEATDEEVVLIRTGTHADLFKK
ncbi:MAG: type II toxin-antitoxin system YafQ family toxin [Bacteroidota bacterium]